MWLVYVCAVAFVARDDVFRGIGTVGGLIGGAYFVHRFSHEQRNFFTVLHHYHHENNDWFAYLSQILIELLFGVVVVPACYAGFAVHPWVTMLFVLIYSSVHNVNYGILKVNQVHTRHHLNVHENIGPDVCDILFHSKQGEAEDTSHYIPNIIISAVITVIVQKLDVVRPHHLRVAGAVGLVLYLAASWYVWSTSSRTTESTPRLLFEKRKRGCRRVARQRAATARRSKPVPAPL